MFSLYNLKRYIRQNWKKLILILMAIIFILVVIQVLNMIAAQENKKVAKDQYGTDVYNPGETVIRGGDISKEKQEENSQLIAKFMEFCNAKNPSAAYDLLTEECKENSYPTLDTFIHNYYSVVFKTTMTASEQSWINRNDRNTYQVKIMEDPLATGKYNGNRSFQDYMTIVEKEGQKKLNINGYIDRYEVNKVVEHNNIKITVQTIDQYKDYQVCNVRVENKTGKTILINTPAKIEGIYLVDSNDNKWTSQLHEISNNLKLENNFYQDLKIKFMKPYNPDLEVKKMIFEDIIMDYPQYLQNTNQYTERGNMEIEL